MGKYWDMINGVEALADEAPTQTPSQSSQGSGGGKYWKMINGIPAAEAQPPAPASAPVDQNQAQGAVMGGGFISEMADKIRGKRDPAYAGTYGFHGQMVQENNQPVLDSIAASSLVSADDARHGDIEAKALGDRFIRKERDANGYDVIVFRGQDGQEQKGYVNRPGLDMEDVSRFVTGSTPYLAAGGLVGKGVQGLHGAARGVLQAIGQGATSIGTDVASSAAGSEQGIDLPRAALSASFGAGGEAVGSVAPALWRRFVTEPKYFDRSAGKLTPLGEQAAKDAGIDPATLGSQLSQTFAKTYAREGGDAARTAGAFADQEFGIPATVGQRTNDASKLLEEKAARFGVYGDQAKSVMKSFDDEQAQKIANAALTGDGKGSKGIVGMLSDRNVPTGLNPSDLGESIRTGVGSAKTAARKVEKDAWDEVGDITPKPEAFDDLPAAIQGQLGPTLVDERLTPTAMLMGKELDAYATGKAIVKDGPKVFGQTPVLTLDQQRRRLLQMYKGTERGSADERASKAIYDGFNDWLGTAAKKSLVNGNPEAAAKMLIARDITKAVKSTFGGAGPKTPGSRMMDAILDESGTVSADSLVSKLFVNNPKAVVRDGTLQILGNIKKGLRYAGPQVAKETWNDIRVANWMRLVQDKQGKMYEPGYLLTNIRTALHSQRSVMQTLYSPAEVSAMHRFAQSLNRVVAKDPNPSGSGVAIAALTRQFLMKLLEAVPYGRTALEYSGLPGAYGKAVAKKAVSQMPPTRSVPIAGGLGQIGRAYGTTDQRQ